MSKLLPLYIICFGLALLSEHDSKYDTTKECYVKKEKTYYLIMAAVAILFAGLRTSYNDTTAYISGYEQIKNSGLFDGVSFNLGSYPGFVIVCNLLRLLGFSSQVFIFVFSAFTVGVEMWFLRKYSNHVALSVYLLFTVGCFGFSMAAIKQCCSTSICLIAIDRQIQKKYGQFVMFILIACLFHPFAIMFLVTPFLEFRPWTIKTFAMIGGAIFLGFNLQHWLGRLIDFISLMGKDYDESLLVGEGVNVLRLAVMWAPVGLSLFTLNYWDLKEEKPVQNLMVNLMMLNASIMLIALFGNPIYFGRLANYFLIFQAIGLSYSIQYFDFKSRRPLIAIIVILYFCFSYYGNVMSGVSFDQSYNRMSLIQFLLNLRG